jgi:hypothetical protein
MGTVLKKLSKGGDCPNSVLSDQMVLGTVRQGLDLVRCGQLHYKEASSRGGHQTISHSDQMVLVMARREARLRSSGQMCSRAELENNSRKPRDLTKNRHSDSLKKGQLTLYQGMMKKGDDLQLMMMSCGEN